MRTTRKEFKDQVQNHIKDSLMEQEELKQQYDVEVKDGQLLQAQLQVVVDSFSNWYGKYEQKMQPNKYYAFQEWLKGLPSVLNIEFTDYGIHHALQTWFENCGDVYDDRKNIDAFAHYLHLVTREFRELCDKYEIEF